MITVNTIANMQVAKARQRPECMFQSGMEEIDTKYWMSIGNSRHD